MCTIKAVPGWFILVLPTVLSHTSILLICIWVVSYAYVQPMHVLAAHTYGLGPNLKYREYGIEHYIIQFHYFMILEECVDARYFS